ncbi:MAG: type 4a pilus biogenesis protein PilO [Stackebrandtia sp.]
MTMTRKWSLLAAVVVIAILAAGWFLAVAPKRADAQAVRGKVTKQEVANQQLQQQIQALKAQALDLPKQRARIAAIRKQVPDNPALPRLIRDLSGSASKAGLSLDSLAPATPVAVVAPTVGGSAPAPAASPAASAPAKGTTPATSPAAPESALYYVPVTLTASGEFAEVEQFVNKIEGLKRAFLVTGLQIGAGSEESAADGANPGLEMTLTGRIYLSPPVKDAKNWPGATATALTPTTAPKPTASAAPAQ